jgi:hypothetical protein
MLDDRCLMIHVIDIRFDQYSELRCSCRGAVLLCSAVPLCTYCFLFATVPL